MSKSGSALIAILLLAASCSTVTSPEYPDIYPDYIGVTVPLTLPGLNFRMADGSRCHVRTRMEGDTLWYSVRAKGVRYREFPVYMVHDSIDPYLAYRLIEPGYESWRNMGLYQRELSSFRETAFVTNKANDNGCVNCHSFSGGDPRKMLFHARGKGGGTVFADGDELRLRNLAGIGPGKQGVYPSWHPDGRYVAFSSNKTMQCFAVKGRKPIEVYDDESDIILFDTVADSVLTCPSLCSSEALETFPCWSSDGRALYFCRADTVGTVSSHLRDLHYGLYSIAFANGKFIGEPVCLWRDSLSSASFPRPNGDRIMFTKSDYATFPIWHREADLWMLNLKTGGAEPADPLNSPEAESYHSWSSNGRWVVFSSRRDDGRFTRLYIAHYDGAGHFDKPFMLPQRSAVFDLYRLKSYNVPEFVRGRVPNRQAAVSKFFH